MPWPSGGSVAVVLARPTDQSLQHGVEDLLQRLKADQGNGIAAIANSGQIARMGANPQASFFIELQPNTTSAGFSTTPGPLLTQPKSKGMHGYFPQRPSMRSTFMIMGPGIEPGRSLGEIDMRAIAPTLAAVLCIPLPSAEKPPVSTGGGGGRAITRSRAGCS
jgi:predicted AlkP superfamily pyrophosphatase or phosphodiesterase